jgi:hypothetical protein
MKKKAFIASPQKYSSILAKKMQDEELWSPVIFLTGNSNLTFVNNHFPEALQLNYIDSVKGIPLNNSSHSFDLKLIESVDIDLKIAVSLLDRNDSNSRSFDYKDRLFFCYEYIVFWANLLDEFKIETILFEEEPHQCSDYILYKVALHKGILTPMMIRTIGDLGIIPTFNFETPNIKLIKQYQAYKSLYDEKEQLEIPRALSSYLQKLSGNYKVILEEHLWDQIDTYQEIFEKGNTFFSVIKTYTKKIILKLLNPQFFNFQSDQKEANKPFAFSKMNYFKYQLYRLKTIRAKIRLFKIYKALAISPNIKNTNYVLCALQYQPEKSTCPLGGKYNDQRLMIMSLREVLPDDVKIIVKEHPSQFIYDYARYGEYYRDKYYYESILAIPNVELVDMKIDIFELIDKSLFVASVTGTICWEAVNRKKPALCFGHSWMTGCEGIFKINSSSELVNAVDIIFSNKHEISLAYVHLFAKAIYDLGFNLAVGGESQLAHKKVTEEENATILFNSIKWLTALN